MSYDYGRKYISKHTGLTGVESKNIARQIKESGLDYQAFDWKTIGEDLYGYGKKTSGVKSKLKSMYGISFDKNVREIADEMSEAKGIETGFIMNELMNIHERRSPHAKHMDYSLRAKKTFKPSNKKGVEKWKRNPNRFDIIGVDDPI